MIRTLALLCLSAILVQASDEPKPTPIPFPYEVARAHEIKPHRRTIPLEGVRSGFNQLRLTLTVSPTGDVIDAEANGDAETLKFWPDLQSEVWHWKFKAFEKDGKTVTAEVEEYLDLVPPERLPKTHVAPPKLQPDSKVKITLRRSGCFGTCPAYEVVVSTESGVTFDGRGFVVASGKRTGNADPDEVRKLAKRFIEADFYSFDSNYSAAVTDNPTYELSIDIDGHSKVVRDYVGHWVGMPAVITELEDAVDEFAQTDRWISGTKGVVDSLREEKFNFGSFEAQVMLKEAATRGNADTVRELLEAGVPLTPLRAPKPKDEYSGVPFEHVGFLTAAAASPETLLLLIKAGASKSDQKDKDLALAQAARSGKVEGVKALIEYGANPNADLSKLTVTESGGGMTMEGPGAGSVLIYAAESGDPDTVREILRYKPNLEKRDREGKTAIFYAGEYRNDDEDGARVECVRLLARAGADVNAKDNDGNTPLHEIFLTDVEEELLKLGANVNSRNNEGETPIFTNVDEESIPLFIKHGADLTIRNKAGQTVFDVAHEKGPAREKALRKAVLETSQQ